jgi:hypothetical protein
MKYPLEYDNPTDFETTQIYTTGAYLRPVKVGTTYIWGVVGFNDDTYNDNGSCCSPCVSATDWQHLLTENDKK